MSVVEGSAYGKYSEYITTKLDASLTTGKSYKFTYYVSLAENSGYAVSGFGAHFSKDAMNQKSNAYIMVTTQVSTSNIVDSKSNWTEISRTFTATGGEQYVTIGVFNGPASSKAAKDYLIKKGVKADHLSSEGYGETRPLADNGTSAGRAKNRRVIVQTTMYKVN